FTSFAFAGARSPSTVSRKAPHEGPSRRRRRQMRADTLANICLRPRPWHALTWHTLRCRTVPIGHSLATVIMTADDGYRCLGTRAGNAPSRAIATTIE